MVDHDEKAATSLQVGALQSSLSITLHTQYAIRLWCGRKRDLCAENGDRKKRPEIIGMPQVIVRAGVAMQDSLADNPYADLMLLRLEERLTEVTTKMQEPLSYLDGLLRNMPQGIALSDVSSVEPLQYSIWVGFYFLYLNKLARKIDFARCENLLHH